MNELHNLCPDIGDVVAVLAIGGICCLYDLSSGDRKQRAAMARRARAIASQFDELAHSLQSSPFAMRSHQQLVCFCDDHPNYRQLGYSLALTLLTESQENSLIKLAQELGRLHYSRNRPDGQPTIGDEEAIQNNIQDCFH